jgi:hypothetical protein
VRKITVTASTLGQSNPAEVEGRKNYKFRKDPNWPHDRSAWTQDPPPGIVPADTRCSTDRKRVRLETFEAALRDLGYTPKSAPGSAVIEAGRRAGVGADTAREYRKELRDRQAGEASDA